MENLNEPSSKAMIGLMGICVIVLLLGIKFLFKNHLDNLPKPVKHTRYQLYKDHQTTSVTNTHARFDTIHLNNWVHSIMIVHNDTIFGHKYKNKEL
jgi:hypothetical protein